MITLIAVVGPDNCLGADGKLLYSLRDDMRHFKEYTLGHPIIMGRKTYESFPGGPLPGRTNIVITRQENYKVPDGVIVVSSVQEAIKAATSANGSENIMVIGGGEIYRQMMPYATDLELTEVLSSPSVVPDTYFPIIDKTCWKQTSSTPIAIDSRSALPYLFTHYHRIQG